MFFFEKYRKQIRITCWQSYQNIRIFQYVEHSHKAYQVQSVMVEKATLELWLYLPTSVLVYHAVMEVYEGQVAVEW